MAEVSLDFFVSSLLPASFSQRFLAKLWKTERNSEEFSKPLRKRATTYSSAIFDIVGVKEIGLRSVLISFTVELFSKGVMFAHFQISANCSFFEDSLINIETGRAKISAKSFRTQLGMLSGLAALCELINLSCLVIISVVTDRI